VGVPGWRRAWRLSARFAAGSDQLDTLSRNIGIYFCGFARVARQNTDGTPAVWLMDELNMVRGTNVGFDPGVAWHVVPQHLDVLV
jgi:hypothetical protein